MPEIFDGVAMYPRIIIENGFINTNYLALLAGALFGWIAYVLDEDWLWKKKGLMEKVNLFCMASLAYFVIVFCCTQGAVYFHFIFDNIPESERLRLTFWDMVFANPLGTGKVIYGSVFSYAVGVFLITFWNPKSCFTKILNRKSFILFIVLGFARVGCFLNGCCYGIRSNLFGISFPANSAVALEHLQRGYTSGFSPPPSLPVIPTQGISALFLFGLAFFALRASKRGVKHVYMRYVLYYAVFRFMIEFLRDDLERAYWWIFSASQWISLFIFAMFALWLIIKKITASRNNHAI